MIDITDLAKVNKMFNDNLVEALTTLQQNTQMEDEHFSTVAGAGFQGAMDNSVKTIATFKNNELADARISNERKLGLIRDQQELAERLKNGGISYTYIYYKSYFNKDGARFDTTEYFTGDEIDTVTISEDVEGVLTDFIYNLFEDIYRIKDKTLSNGTQKSNYEAQRDLILKQFEKVKADITFVGKQGTNMDKQVMQNCIIQAMDKAEGYNQGIGQAGLIPSQAMHTNFFIQNKALLVEGGVTFVETGTGTGEDPYVTTAMLGEIELGVFVVNPTATEQTV